MRARVALTTVMFPLTVKDRKPQGASSSSAGSAPAGATTPDGTPAGSFASGGAGGTAAKVLLDEIDGLFRMTHVRAVPRCFHELERARGHPVVHVLPHGDRCDRVVGELDDERRRGNARQI